jgi:proton-translocating NADH-quinone oxidoreductase chain L
MYLLVLFLPAISSFISGFFGIFLGKKGVIYINIGSMISTFLVACLIFYEVCFFKYVCIINTGTWFQINNLEVRFDFLFDTITATMLLVVSLVSLLVHLYSVDYMSEDPHIIRFLTYLTIFTFFMFILLTAGNFIQIFAGWEGVGLASYLLINFWYTRTQANTSALKALIINRFGDFALYTAIVLIFLVFKSVDFFTIFSMAYTVNPFIIQVAGIQFSVLNLICFFLFLGAVGKSAQIGLHVWLPDAMEGPTPVSALIHAATMVTAGIFLIIRCSPLFELAPAVLQFVAIMGALTAFFAASIGLVQNDIKKVIAFSTCSQLGYMIFSCGVSNYSASFFHLINHAFFKALLFLCAGSVIHALANEQDIRKMGHLAKILPITYVLMLIGSLSLLGFPFLTGFYSKDIILEVTYSTYSISALFAFCLGIFSVFFTSFYSCRLLHLTFLGTSININRKIVEAAHEAPKLMLIAFIPLAFGSIFWGYLTKDFFVGLGTNFWQTSVYILPNNYNIIEAEFLPLSIKLIPFVFSMCGIILSIIVYYGFTIKPYSVLKVKFPIFGHIYNFLIKKWYFDLLYNQIFSKFYFIISYKNTFKLIDRGLLEYFGPTGIVKVTSKLSKYITSLYSGFLYQYIFFSLSSFFILSCFNFLTTTTMFFTVQHSLILFCIWFIYLIFKNCMKYNIKTF